MTQASKSKSVTESLTQVLATTYSLYLQTQNFHWNVESAEFISLHQLYGAQYDEYSQAIDEIAEHLRTLGVVVPGSFAAFAKHSQIKQVDGLTDSREQLKVLIAQTKTLITLLTDTANLADEADDLESEDLTISRLRAHRKHLWMLESSL